MTNNTLRKIVRIDESKLLNRAAGGVFFSLPTGIIRRVNGIDELKSLPGVYRVELDGLATGKKLEAMKDMTGRHGPIVYAGKDRQACEQTIRSIQRTLKIEVDTSKGIKSPEWN